MWQYNNYNELCHYGVLGMKWGRRRFQNEDGTPTKVGKAKSDLADANSAYSKAYKIYNKKTLGGLLYKEKEEKALEKAAINVDYAQKELSDSKFITKMQNQSKKSNHQIDLEKKYMAQGLTQKEAELTAYKRVRTEKIIAVTAGVTLAAATAYVAYKHYDNTVDKIIKSGTILQNISTDSNKGVGDAFYASKTKMDNAKYRGIYGNQLKTGGPFGNLNNSVYETKIGVGGSLKLASKKSATQTLSELVKSDKNYAQTFENQLSNLSGRMGTPKQNKLIQEAIKNLNSGKVDHKVYEALNLALVDHSPEGHTVSKGFYELLKSKGYDAIKDINDSTYSGYKSANPLIVFNGKTKTAVNSVRELGSNEIKKNMAIGYADIAGKEIVKTGATYAAAVFGVSTSIKAVESTINTKIVKEYRKKHPESTLSYNEIVRNNKG